MVGIAYVLPYQTNNNIFNLERFIDWGITIIFLLYGLKLNLKDLVKDLSNWKLHLIIQCSTFLLFPILAIAGKFLFIGEEWYLVWLSLYFLACLPSTVSSSVVMVSLAKGNMVSAIFNATISGLIGIVATPFLLDFYIKSNENVEGNNMVLELCLKVLLPLIIGLILNPYLKNFIEKYKNYVAEFDKLIILLIVYESFSKAFIANVFTAFPLTHFLVIVLGAVVLFFMVFGILKVVSRTLRFNYEDTVTTLFCGSKKSLVHGSVFLSLLALSADAKVLFLLPIMLYHSFQLFFISWLANKWGTSKN